MTLSPRPDLTPNLKPNLKPDLKFNCGALTLVALTALMIGVMGCAEPFIVASRSTPDFPLTWQQRLSSLKRGSSAARISPTSRVTRPAMVARPAPQPQTGKRVIPPPPTLKGATQRIAVLEMLNRAPQLVTQDEVSYLSNELRTVASYLPSPRFLVLTKESLESLIDPSVSLEECVGSCAVETGRMVGARWILTGEVVRFGKSLRVSLKIHDTEGGHFLKGAAVKGRSVEELEEALHTQALTLIKEVSPEWGRWLDQVAPDDLKAQLKHLRSRNL